MKKGKKKVSPSSRSRPMRYSLAGYVNEINDVLRVPPLLTSSAATLYLEALTSLGLMKEIVTDNALSAMFLKMVTTQYTQRTWNKSTDKE